MERDMVKKFALQRHQWINEMYKKKYMWAQSHLSGHFFKTIMSTSCCEGLNSFIASLSKERKTLLEFVRAIENGIKNIRNNEIGEDYIFIHTEPVSSQIFKDIEKHVVSVYTRRTFKKFIDEMRLQQLYYHECRIDDEPSIRMYHLMKYTDLSEQTHVEFHVNDENIKCSCLKFETNGIPCPHIIHVMILEQLNRIPLNLIMKRWTKNAKDDAPAVVDDNAFNKARSEIASLTRRYEDMCKVNTDRISNLTEHVHDPTRVKVKGKLDLKLKGKKKATKMWQLQNGSCLLDDNDIDVYERNKEVWPSQLGTLFGGDSSEED
ncbi:zinc finger protein [Theobroma cacao]|nr:zinc finger protein [Theobroma cacao]